MQVIIQSLKKLNVESDKGLQSAQNLQFYILTRSVRFPKYCCLLFGSVVPKRVMQHSKFITNQSLLLKCTTSNDCVLTSLYPRLYIFSFLYRDVIYTLKTFFENPPKSERQMLDNTCYTGCFTRGWTQQVCLEILASDTDSLSVISVVV